MANIFELGGISENYSTFLTWLQTNGLVPDSKDCPTCQGI